MKLEDIATTPLITAPPDRSIAAVARQMSECEVGCVVVTTDEGGVIGIVTDRDLVVRAIARAVPADSPVSTVMSTGVVQLPGDKDVEAACNIMAAWGVRRVPILNRDGAPFGMVSLDDVTRRLAEAIDQSVTATRTRRVTTHR